MRCIVVGLGVQGRKRLAVAGADVVGTVDPVAGGAQYRDVAEVPPERFDAALVCTPDAAKLGALEYLLGLGKHVLVEKPVLCGDEDRLRRLAALGRRTGAACYTAYNHRFEPHIVRLKELLDGGAFGTVYLARLFYGNGTARDVQQSPWRDQGMGVLADLGSHLLDLTLFLFGEPASPFVPWTFHRFENRAFDHISLGCPADPALELEASLVSWRNTFTIDVVGETGSVHLNGLCKWGPSTLTLRRRSLPSGKPREEAKTVECPDPTWAAEYAHFKQLCATGGSNLDNDIWINSVLKQLAHRVAQRVPA
jgi:predicted dehydrogenase